MSTHRARRSLAQKLTLALVLSGVTAAAVLAAAPSFWRLENQADFLPGDTDGVSIDSDGTITLAPATQVVAELTEPHLWSLAIDRSGDVYAGSGNEGMVFRVDSQDRLTTITDTEDLQVQAIAIDRRGNAYIGTSPGGAVYELDGDRRDVFFDPDERYIWALAADSVGNLIVATGDPARIYRVSSSGESELLFSSEETHVVSLAVDANDNVYAGTESNGLVLKIDRNGSSSVLFDTPFQEVRAIVTDTRGNVFAATVNGGARASSPPQAATTTTPPSPSFAAGGGGATVTVTATANVSASSGSSPATSGGSLAGALYRIDPDGAADQLWESRTDTPLALSLARDDRLLIGTGSDGRVYLVGQDKTSSLLLSVAADQVTAIAPGSDGSTFLATSNPAKIYRLNRGRRTEGIYRSPTMDTETMSSWGKIRWEARTPQGTTVTLQTRSGNSAEPDNTWSEWSQPYAAATGEQVTSPRGRFFEWRAVLNSTGELSPELYNVTAIYLQQNLAPQIAEITVHPPGQAFQKPIVTAGQLDVLGMDNTLVDESTASGMAGQAPGGAGAMSVTAMARPFFRKGIQTITWRASDANDDELSFDVEYRSEGETLWRTLREGLKSPVIAWDTVAMPDGRYTLRIVASDVRSNPTELAKTSQKASRSFEVDNTPPTVSGLSAASEGQGYRVRFSAEDAISPIQTVEYAINSGQWRVIFPTDGIADSPTESFDFTLPNPGQGVYTLVVKVTDKLGNTSTARTELR